MKQVQDFDIRLLRIFATVAETGSFVATQKLLNLAPSTLSEQIKDLELRLGFSVCIRGRGGFKLTPQGEDLYKVVKDLLASLENTRNQIQRINGLFGGVLAIGIVDSVSTDQRLGLHDVIQSFHAAKPQVHVTLHVDSPPRLETALLEGRLDIAIGPFNDKSRSLRYTEIYEEPQILCCGRNHPLFACTPEALDDNLIAAQAFVAADYSTQLVSRFSPTTVTTTVEAMLILIMSGLYIGYLPSHLAERWIVTRDIHPLAPERLCYLAKFYVVRRSTATESPLQAAFLRRLSQALARHAP